MRKLLYVVSVVIIVGLLSAAYYITGVRAEKEFNAFLKSADNIPNLTISADNYQRGWLKSTAHIHAVLHRPPQEYMKDQTMETAPAQDISFSFDITIYHGPIIFANKSIFFGLGYAQTDIPLPDEVLSQFSQVFTENSTKPNCDLSLLLRYRGKLDVNLDISPFILTSKDGVAQINWEGFHGHWEIYRRLARIKGFVDFDGMTFKMGDSNGSVGSVHLKYNMENAADGLLSGEASLGLKTFQATEGAFSVAVNGFQAVSKSSLKSKDNVQLIDSSLKADVSKVTYRGVDYGPGVLDIDVSNLDAEALGQIQQKIQAASNNNLTEAQQQMFVFTLLPEVSRLLERGAELQVKQLQLSVPEGLIIATAKIKLPTQANENHNTLLLIQQTHATVMAEAPVAWLNHRLTDFLQFKIMQRQLMEKQMANGTAKEDSAAKNLTPNNKDTASSTSVETVKSLSPQEMNTLATQQATEQLQNLVQNGILIQKNDVYRIRVTFKDGTFYINGKPFNNKQVLEGEK
jgi:uncharacterized protein YdgA (DUF945 family)